MWADEGTAALGRVGLQLVQVTVMSACIWFW
jgi:hypothetical protein